MHFIADALNWLFRTSGFLKRGNIPGWSEALTTTQTIADTTLAAGLLTLAGLLWVFACKRGGWSHAIGAGPHCLAAALFLNAFTTAFRVLYFWWPVHRLGAILQGVSALSVWVAVGALVTTIPRFLRFLAERESDASRPAVQNTSEVHD